MKGWFLGDLMSRKNDVHALAAAATAEQRKAPVSIVTEHGALRGFRDYFKARTGWDYPTLQGPAHAPDGGSWTPDVVVILADYLDAVAERTKV